MTTDENSAVDGTDFIGHSVEGKHLLLKVPDYEDTGRSSLLQQTKETYLNLGRGTGDPDWPLPTWYATAGRRAEAAVVADPNASPPVVGRPAVTAIAQERQTDSDQKWSAGGLDSSVAASPLTSGDDLLAFFGGFVDDTRLRAGGGTFDEPTATPPNEGVARTAASAPFSAVGATAATTGAGRNLQVTETIPDYLGWRDHTDGHRITTTRGDKIEIIGGNYKIVSLGRGQGVAQYEMSGGIIVDGDEPPGGISSVTWRECPTGDALTAAETAALPTGSTATRQSGWKVVEQVVQGHNVTRFHGTVRDEVYGDRVVSVTGAPTELTAGLGLGRTTTDGTNLPAPAESASAALKAAYEAAKSRDGTEEALFPSTRTEEPWRPEGLAMPTKWDESGGTPPKLQQPEILESTWAKSITGYTKTAGASTDHVHVGGTLTEKLRVDGDHKVYAEYSDSSGFSGTTKMNGYGKKYIETWAMESSMGFYEYFKGAMTQFFFGASTTMGLANRFEIFVGIEEQVNLGAFFEIKMGGMVGVNVGAQLEVSAGPKLELETKTLKFWLAKEDTGLSDLTTCLSFYKAALTKTTCGLSTTTIAAIQKL